jgi:hydrogenase nickel incorporation protein HypB
MVPVEVHHHLLATNDRMASHTRTHFEELGVLAINLMGSPGSGKTALLEATARSAGAGCGWAR